MVRPSTRWPRGMHGAACRQPVRSETSRISFPWTGLVYPRPLRNAFLIAASLPAPSRAWRSQAAIRDRSGRASCLRPPVSIHAASVCPAFCGYPPMARSCSITTKLGSPKDKATGQLQFSRRDPGCEVVVVTYPLGLRDPGTRYGIRRD